MVEYFTHFVNIKTVKSYAKQGERRLIMSIYQNVKKACSDNGITITYLESKLGFPRSSVCKWDTNTPGVDKVQAVAKELNKPIEYFLE